MDPASDPVVPATRPDGLVVEHLAGETLIYDLERDQVHHLNDTAAVVFELCDGRTTVGAVSPGRPSGSASR
jgi:Coenzyme PQQ synthesis protein D (PqqD)